MPAINVGLTDELHDLLIRLAGKHKRSMANEIRYLIEQGAYAAGIRYEDSTPASRTRPAGPDEEP